MSGNGVLTTVYRPGTFEEVVGQKSAVKLLKSVSKNRENAPKSLILYGPWGTGKTTLARVFARSLVCKSFLKTGKVCMICEGCKSIGSGTSTSVYMEYDSSQVGNVQQIRDLRPLFDMYTEHFRVIVLDECLHPSAPVLLADGSTVPARRLVNEKMQVDVMSYNYVTGKYEPKPVVNWFKNSVRELRSYKFKTSKGKTRSVTATESHKFMLPNGHYKLASDMVVGDEVMLGDYHKFTSSNWKGVLLHKKRRFNFTDALKQFIAGAILGDGTVNRTTNGTPRIRWTHGHKQESYINFKYSLISHLCKTGVRVFYPTAGNYGFGVEDYYYLRLQTCAYAFWKEVVDAFYGEDGTKCITETILPYVGAMTLAWWYMDDGHLTSGGVVNLCTHGFTKSENVYLIEMLKTKFDVSFKLSYDKRCKKYFLSTDRSNTAKFLDIVAPYFEKGILDYKLGGRTPGGLLSKQDYGEFYYEDLTEFGNSTYMEHGVGTFVGVGSRVERRSTYNFEVKDNHNYIVNGVLNRNCHLLSRQSQAALLKAIEEGNDKTFFVFCTTDYDKVLKTIQSRSLPVELHPVDPVLMQGHLRNISDKEGQDVPEDVLKQIVFKADGHVRDAVMLLSGYITSGDVSILNVPVDDIRMFFEHISSGSFKEARSLVDTVMQYPLYDIRKSFNFVVSRIVEAVMLSQDNEYTLIAKVYKGDVLKLFKLTGELWTQGVMKDKYLVYSLFLTLMRLYGRKK